MGNNDWAVVGLLFGVALGNEVLKDGMLVGSIDREFIGKNLGHRMANVMVVKMTYHINLEICLDFVLEAC